MAADYGPFETAGQASEAVRRAFEDSREGRKSLRTSGYAMLNTACSASRVRTGDYDRRIMDWLAGIEIQMCAVFAGLIMRAYQAGLEAEGERLGYVVVTFNQASGRPGLDYPDLHEGITDAMCERDLKREETAAAGRGERHVIAEVTEMEGDG